jgi:hypothetical protein
VTAMPSDRPRTLEEIADACFERISKDPRLSVQATIREHFLAALREARAQGVEEAAKHVESSLGPCRFVDELRALAPGSREPGAGALHPRCKAHAVPYPCAECEKDAPVPTWLPMNHPFAPAAPPRDEGEG